MLRQSRSQFSLAFWRASRRRTLPIRPSARESWFRSPETDSHLKNQPGCGMWDRNRLVQPPDVTLYLLLHYSEFYPSAVVRRSGPVIDLQRHADAKLGAGPFPVVARRDEAGRIPCPPRLEIAGDDCGPPREDRAGSVSGHARRRRACVVFGHKDAGCPGRRAAGGRREGRPATHDRRIRPGPERNGVGPD